MPNIFNENIFIPVIQNPKYEVNYRGEVRSVATGKTLAQQACRKGYLSLKLQGKRVKIHRIVMASFYGEDKREMTVNHKDGVKTNNHVQNLEWMTSAENVKHSALIGLRNYNKKENHPRYKTTPGVVSKITDLKKRGYGNTEIGKIVGLSRGVVWKVVKGRHFSCKGCTEMHSKAV